MSVSQPSNPPSTVQADFSFAFLVGQVKINAVSEIERRFALTTDEGFALCRRTLDAGERTLLMEAARHGSLECVQRLLPQSELGAKDGSQGNDALMLAAQSNQARVLAFLLTHARAGQTNSFNEDGDSALMLAALNGHIECVRALIGHCDVDLQSTRSARANPARTAVEMALQNKKFDCVDVLVAHSKTPYVTAKKIWAAMKETQSQKKTLLPQTFALIERQMIEPQSIDRESAQGGGGMAHPGETLTSPKEEIGGRRTSRRI